MKAPMTSYDGTPPAAKDVKDTKMLDVGARESASRTTGTPNYDRSKTKHGPLGMMGCNGFADGK